MSLRRALQLRLLVPVALLLMASSAVAYGLSLHYANSIYDSWLYDIAHTVTLEVGEDGPEVVHTEEIEQQLKTWTTGDHDYYSITVEGRIIAGDHDLPPPPARTERYSQDAYLYDADRDGKHLRLMTLHAPANAQRPALDVRVAQDKLLRYRLAQDMFYTVAVPGVLLIAIAALLIRIVVRSTFTGLDDLTRRLAMHPEGKPLAIDAGKLPSELRALTVAFAGLVERNNGLLKAQRQFLANAAHQLRSPMAATELHLDGVEHAESPAQRRLSLSQLRRAVERTNRLAQQLLSLARLEPGTRLPIPMRRVDLAETLRAAGADYVPLALNKGIDIELDVPELPLFVLGHELLLREAFSNLIDNAVRYHPGGGSLLLRAEAAGSLAKVSIEDDGPGLAPGLSERLFERFVRSDAVGGEGAAQGSGLGLSIVREIVELHHGRVRAEPGSSGRGLAMRVDLPLVTAVPAGAKPVAGASAVPGLA